MCASMLLTKASMWDANATVSARRSPKAVWLAIDPACLVTRSSRSPPRQSAGWCRSSHGTNSGRSGSPCAEGARLRLNSAICSGSWLVSPGANGQRHAVGLHAHAPGLVDRRRATIELPRDPQRGDGGHEDQQQKGCPHHQQFGAQTPVALDHHGLNQLPN